MAGVLALIPARGGSKGIPGKNLALLAGRPLLSYTCQAALASKRLTRVVLSTDDERIAAAGREMGVDVPFMRPADLATDESPMLDVIQHALQTLDHAEGYRPDVVVLLQPTSPLRRGEHIDAAVDLLLRSGADSVVSVVEVPHQFNPVSVLRLEGERLVPYLPGPQVLRRQDKPRVYARNGPAVLASRRATLMEAGSLYGNDVRPLFMGHEESLDVDGPFDLMMAELLLGRDAARP